jgi:divinyl protochlorophyllide a 8-vinyl-reductase
MTTLESRGGDHTGAAPSSGKIGPNSLIQTVQSLKDFYGEEKARRILQEGGQGHLLTYQPHEMIDEGQFITLARMLYRDLGLTEALTVLRRSGNLTGEYVLKNRLPRPVQFIIKLLPQKLALKMMLTAIGKNSWTFAGSGTYTFTTGSKPQIFIQNTILRHAVEADRPACSYYRGAFETLLKTLVSKRLEVEEVECGAAGADRCVFNLTLQNR